MKQIATLAGLLLITLPVLVACGSETDDADSVELAGSITEAELPGDFPRSLIPPEYDRIDYSDLRHIGSVEGVAFQTAMPVDESIAYYTGLLGEPTLSVVGDDGDRNASWHELSDPQWVLGVMGGHDESFVTVSRLPGN